MPWELTGNSGTNPDTNFLGTTDNQPLSVRTNGAERMRLDASGSRFDVLANSIRIMHEDQSVFFAARTNTELIIFAGGTGLTASLSLADSLGNIPFTFTANNANLIIGSQGNDGDLFIRDTAGNNAFDFDGATARLIVGTEGNSGDIHLHRGSGETTILLDAGTANLFVGASGNNSGDIVVRDGNGATTIHLDAGTPRLFVSGIIESTSGGFRYPDGSVQTTATAQGPRGERGPKGEQGEPGERGPAGVATETFAVCAPLCGCTGDSVLLSRVSGPCVVTSQTGSCNAPSGNQCCECAGAVG